MRSLHVPWPYTRNYISDKGNVSVSGHPLGLGRIQGWGLWADSWVEESKNCIDPGEGGSCVYKGDYKNEGDSRANKGQGCTDEREGEVCTVNGGEGWVNEGDWKSNGEGYTDTGASCADKGKGYSNYEGENKAGLHRNREVGRLQQHCVDNLHSRCGDNLLQHRGKSRGRNKKDLSPHRRHYAPNGTISPDSPADTCPTPNSGGKTEADNMSTPKSSHRGNNMVENGGLVLLALSKVFRDEEDIMEIESPAQSLKKLLAEKGKNQTKTGTHGKRSRNIAKFPREGVPTTESSSMYQVKFKFWLGFEAMEKLAKEQGLKELFTDESIVDRITRGIPRKEAEELECISISYSIVPQTLYPSERSIMRLLA